MRIGVINLYYMVPQLKKIGFEAEELFFDEFFDNKPSVEKIKDFDFLQLTLFNPYNYDKVIEQIKIAKENDVKIIRYWVGTDVFFVLYDLISRKNAKKLDRYVDINVANANKMVEELKICGIDAIHCPTVSNNLGKIFSFPKKFRVLTYIPDERKDFYHSDDIYRLAKEFPKIEFWVVAGKGQKKAPNIKYLGRVDDRDMEQIYKQTSILIRWTQHDSYSRMVIEAMSYGRQVIRNMPFPCCRYFYDYGSLKKHLISIIKNNKINYEGAEYVKKHYNLNFILDRIKKIYQNKLSEDEIELRGEYI